ncbi:MAG: hypothetical protein JWN59_340 [Sphingomonas bacterium]|nr:hypothetical protein [Sphingomonas bacterium]
MNGVYFKTAAISSAIRHQRALVAQCIDLAVDEEPVIRAELIEAALEFDSNAYHLDHLDLSHRSDSLPEIIQDVPRPGRPWPA